MKFVSVFRMFLSSDPFDFSFAIFYALDHLFILEQERYLLKYMYFSQFFLQDKCSLDEALHQFQTRIFSHAHPESEVCTQQAKFTNAHDVLMPLDGFLW